MPSYDEIIPTASLITSLDSLASFKKMARVKTYSAVEQSLVDFRSFKLLIDSRIPSKLSSLDDTSATIMRLK